MIRSSRAAYLRHHLCELLLLLALAAPVVAVQWSTQTLAIVGFFFIALFGLGYWTDMASSLRIDADGVSFREGGQDPRFLAWSEIGELVPRHFRGWPAEDALVALSHDGRPLLVAGVSMFRDADRVRIVEFARQHVLVTPAVFLSPFTARADGHRRPELAPQRTSERLLASAAAGLLMTLVIAAAIFLVVEARPV